MRMGGDSHATKRAGTKTMCGQRAPWQRSGGPVRAGARERPQDVRPGAVLFCGRRGRKRLGGRGRHGLSPRPRPGSGAKVPCGPRPVLQDPHYRHLHSSRAPQLARSVGLTACSAGLVDGASATSERPPTRVDRHPRTGRTHSAVRACAPARAPPRASVTTTRPSGRGTTTGAPRALAPRSACGGPPACRRQHLTVARRDNIATPRRLWRRTPLLPLTPTASVT